MYTRLRRGRTMPFCTSIIEKFALVRGKVRRGGGVANCPGSCTAREAPMPGRGTGGSTRWFPTLSPSCLSGPAPPGRPVPPAGQPGAITSRSRKPSAHHLRPSRSTCNCMSTPGYPSLPPHRPTTKTKTTPHPPTRSENYQKPPISCTPGVQISLGVG